MARKTKTADEMRADLAKMDAGRKALAKQIRAAERAEAKERAARQAEADRALADALLGRLRAAFGGDVSDEELPAAVDTLLTLTDGAGATVVQIAVRILRGHDGGQH